MKWKSETKKKHKEKKTHYKNKKTFNKSMKQSSLNRKKSFETIKIKPKGIKKSYKKKQIRNTISCWKKREMEKMQQLRSLRGSKINKQKKWIHLIKIRKKMKLNGEKNYKNCKKKPTITYKLKISYMKKITDKEN